jgi:hypothetical protein
MLPADGYGIPSICQNFESKGSTGYDEISSTVAKSWIHDIISPLD